jgi:hypothetical protein
MLSSGAYENFCIIIGIFTVAELTARWLRECLPEVLINFSSSLARLSSPSEYHLPQLPDIEMLSIELLLE